MSAPVRTMAAVMTCHNRRAKTLRCLKTLEEQRGCDQIRLRTFVVDDGSSDGTGAAVAEQFPGVTVLAGDGSLYWNGGMRKALARAMAEGFDFYLWLNDDTVLQPNALARLLETFDALQANGVRHPIVVGSLCDPDTGALTYGGSRCTSRRNPLAVSMIMPGDAPQRCDVFNGNIVLVPAAVAHAVGNLSEHFKHRGGDYDYALRARQLGFEAWIAPGYLGQCARNSIAGTWRDTSLPRRVRIRKLLEPTGMPVGERFYFVSRFGGPFWPVHFISVYLRFLAGLLKRSAPLHD
jgi:GT2 family glycosyltransferase